MIAGSGFALTDRRSFATICTVVALDDCIQWIVALVERRQIPTCSGYRLLRPMRTLRHLTTCGAL
jgi:hypothetical protein